MAEKVRAALFIDADNLPLAQATEALGKLEEICTPVIRKAFGDFTKSAKSWDRDFLQKNGITPVQHFPVTSFKNGADIAMTIAVMDLLNAGSVDAIILFTSDSDFGALAARIREQGVYVIGVGDKNANENFQAFFSKFIVVENAKVAKPSKPKAKTPTKKIQTQAKKATKSIAAAEQVITAVIEKCTQKDGWAELSELGKRLKNRNPKFVYSQYGAGRANLINLLKQSNKYALQPNKKPTKVRLID